MRTRLITASLVALAAAMAATAAHADITVGLIISQTGPVSSIGIPYARGIAAGQVFQGDVGGEKIKVITLDDTSDPSVAAKNAR